MSPFPSLALLLAWTLNAQELPPPPPPVPVAAEKAEPAPAPKPVSLKAKAQRAVLKEEAARKALDQAQQERERAELQAAQADLKLRLEHLDQAAKGYASAEAARKKAKEQAKAAWQEAQAARAVLAKREGRKHAPRQGRNPYSR